MSKITPTVDQIAQDHITKLANEYWLNQKDLKPKEINENLVKEIYLNELVNTKFSLRRIMLLEFSQYLENYLWEHFRSDFVSTLYKEVII